MTTAVRAATVEDVALAAGVSRRSTSGPVRADLPGPAAGAPGAAAAVAVLRAAGYRVVEVPAAASAEVLAELLAAEPGPGAVVVTV